MTSTLPGVIPTGAALRGSGMSGSWHGWCPQLSACLQLAVSPLQVPFTVLQGEGVEYLGHANDAVIAISNYRLHIKFKDSVINVSPHLPVPAA